MNPSSHMRFALGGLSGFGFRRLRRSLPIFVARLKRDPYRPAPLRQHRPRTGSAAGTRTIQLIESTGEEGILVWLNSGNLGKLQRIRGLNGLRDAVHRKGKAGRAGIGPTRASPSLAFAGDCR